MGQAIQVDVKVTSARMAAAERPVVTVHPLDLQPDWPYQVEDCADVGIGVVLGWNLSDLSVVGAASNPSSVEVHHLIELRRLGQRSVGLGADTVGNVLDPVGAA